LFCGLTSVLTILVFMMAIPTSFSTSYTDQSIFFGRGEGLLCWSAFESWYSFLRQKSRGVSPLWSSFFMMIVPEYTYITYLDATRDENSRKRYCLYENDYRLVRNLPGFIISLLISDYNMMLTEI
jgi:hypothetical protein